LIVVKDLFGHDVDLDQLARAPMRHGGRRKRRDPFPSGHIMPPGTGPAGETCKSCRHLVRIRLAKTYLKCGQYRAHWTGGRKTDVRARDAACRKWESKDE
jgi:hypothetical protein